MHRNWKLWGSLLPFSVLLIGYTALSEPPVKKRTGTKNRVPPSAASAPSQTSASAKGVGKNPLAPASLFWSFRPVVRPALPPVKNTAWVKSPVDAFVLAEMEKHGLSPAPPAEKRTLIRRVTFDLTGLPPTPEEVANFLQDKSPDAFAKVVDRLLASPRYGERQARHWLDIVRYADSLDARGLGGEGDIADAWRYRDWVVDAFNRDMSYGDFIRNQIAGDVLPGAIPGDINIPGTIATGLLAIGNWGNGDADKEKILTDIADDQLDVVSRAFMGLTIACARCHDHKFDPISTKDYYGMAGIFFSSHILPKLTPKGAGETPLRVPLMSKAALAEREQSKAKITERERTLNAEREKAAKALAQSLQPQTARYIMAAWDYANRSDAEAGVRLAQFAAQRGLHEYALRQWSDTLGMGDAYRLMTQRISGMLGNPGGEVWKGEADCPSLTVNTNKTALRILTFTLPPRSVNVHPGPTNGVVVSWQSPMQGKVRITGKVEDADPAGGDGIAWAIDHRTAGRRTELASGDIPNGGKQEFAKGKIASDLNTISVRAGDRIQLLVLPKAEYTCDTTTVQLEITALEGGKVWNLTRDIVDDPHQNGKGNPHPDSYGNGTVWHFLDMADSKRTGGTMPFSPALAHWQETIATLSAQISREEQRKTVARAAEQFQQSYDGKDAGNPFLPRNRADETAFPAEVQQRLAALTAERETYQRKVSAPVQYANGVQEGGCPESSWAGFHDAPVHIRGSYLRLGERVPRRFPLILAGNNQKPITQGSGRRELAEWIASPSHPLTARVFVNRLWQQHFGAGIVRTPGNFGMLGERPTHPELLDWLASEFVRQGGSIKRLHRLLLLSATYQQSSSLQNIPAKVRGVVPKSKMVVDPDNRWLSRMPHKRLEAEALRDNLLAVSGKLDTTMGGVGEREFNKPRRTVYMMTIRSDRTGFGPLFDGADTTACIDRRTVSTVAPQALFLLNSAFTTEQAHQLATRLMQEIPEDAGKRIARAYELLYARPPIRREKEIGLAFLNAPHPTLTNTRDNLVQRWGEYAQILLCANEFLYVD